MGPDPAGFIFVLSKIDNKRLQTTISACTRLFIKTYFIFAPEKICRLN